MFRAVTRWIREGRCAIEKFPENGGGLRAVWSLGSCGGEGARRAASSRFCDDCWLLRPGEVLQNGAYGLGGMDCDGALDTSTRLLSVFEEDWARVSESHSRSVD